MKETCATCKYYDKEESCCRKRPPSSHVTLVPQGNPLAPGRMEMTMQINGVFPPVKPEAWCGAYFPKEEEAPSKILEFHTPPPPSA
jgi:hypothetical protein